MKRPKPDTPHSVPARHPDCNIVDNLVMGLKVRPKPAPDAPLSQGDALKEEVQRLNDTIEGLYEDMAGEDI